MKRELTPENIQELKEKILPGYRCKAKGAIGCWIVLAERGEWNGNTYPIKEVKAFEVDGKKVKADTWYMLVNGQLKEV